MGMVMNNSDTNCVDNILGAELDNKMEKVSRPMADCYDKSQRHNVRPIAKDANGCIRCTDCSKQSKCKSHLRKHMRNKHNELLKYNICHATFPTLSTMRFHRVKVHVTPKRQKRNHSNPKTFSCLVCKQTFSRLTALVAHEHQQHGDICHPCKRDDGGQNFNREDASAKHKIEIHGEAEESDTQAKALLEVSKNSGKSEEEHLESRRFECEMCDRHFKLRRSLKRHIESCHMGKRFECDICGLELSSKSSLKCHLLLHNGDRSFQCEICSATFATKYHFTSHVRKHKNNSDRPFKCDICAATFTASNHLTSHQRIHSDDRPYKCVDCFAGFKFSKHLKSHMQIHSTERLYKCDKCSASFKQRKVLNKHLKTHNPQVRPFHCTECTATFIFKNHLKRHMTTHSDERPFECDVCLARFKRSDKLLQHLRSHDDDVYFECETCSVKYKQFQTLKLHMQRIHKEAIDRNSGAKHTKAAV